MAPSKRASFAMVLHKNRAIMFGGASDEETKGGEVLDSTFFNELYQLDLDRWRWFPVTMRLETARGTASGAFGGPYACFYILLSTDV
jgi:hypothetical protein